MIASIAALTLVGRSIGLVMMLKGHPGNSNGSIRLSNGSNGAETDGVRLLLSSFPP